MLTLRSRLFPALLALVTVAAAALLYAGALHTPLARATPAAADYVTVEDRLMYPATSIATVTYSPSSLGGRDPRVITGWAGGDAFITADFATTGTLTTTVQFSADGASWADAKLTAADGSEVALGEVITDDGTGMVHIPVGGQYVRFKLDPSASVTPSIRLVLREPLQK